MSLLATRVSMIHRTTVQRDSSAGSDDGWGNPDAPDWDDHLTDLPCRAVATAAREPIDTDRTVVVEDRRMLVPAGTDITERDRVGSITYRGRTIMEGPMGVETVIHRGTHLEVVLVRIR